MNTSEVQAICERAMGRLCGPWDDDAATVLSLGELRKIVETACEVQREKLQPIVDAAAKLDACAMAAGLELWRLLDVKGVPPKEARNWPEIVAIKNARAAYTAALNVKENT